MAAAASRLPRRPLGATGLEVSIIGFGASPLGSVFESIDESEGVAAVHEAFRLGVNFFDTSPFYGLTRSEAVLGRALRGLPREEIVVATKCGRYGESEFDFSRARILSGLRASLARLGLRKVDVLYAHDVEFGSPEAVLTEAIPAMLEAKALGLADHVGVSGLPLDVLRAVLRRAPPGAVEVVLSYCHATLSDDLLAQEFLPAVSAPNSSSGGPKDQEAERPRGAEGAPQEGALHSASEGGALHGALDGAPLHGAFDGAALQAQPALAAPPPAPSLSGLAPAIVNASAFGMGLFTPQGPPAWHPAPPALLAAAAAARAAAAPASIAAVALRHSVFRSPRVASTLVGLCTREQVREAVRVATEPETEEERAAKARVDAALAGVRNLGWPSGRDEWRQA